MEAGARAGHAQQRPETPFLEVCTGIAGTLEEAYRRIQCNDRRWCVPWQEVELMLNPNGPLLNGGSDGDNGQTGRKLVMDYYGPRIPIGGGALYGKDPMHIDRVGARVARERALRAVGEGAAECLVRMTYAPGVTEPIDVAIDATPGRVNRPQPAAPPSARRPQQALVRDRARTGH